MSLNVDRKEARQRWTLENISGMRPSEVPLPHNVQPPYLHVFAYVAHSGRIIHDGPIANLVNQIYVKLDYASLDLHANTPQFVYPQAPECFRTTPLRHITYL